MATKLQDGKWYVWICRDLHPHYYGRVAVYDASMDWLYDHNRLGDTDYGWNRAQECVAKYFQEMADEEAILFRLSGADRWIPPTSK